MKKIIIVLLIIVCFSYSFTIGTYNGIDISHHNNVCWKCVAKDTNIKFCYIKATEGSLFKDQKCFENIENATKLNLNIGLYHYFRTNVSPTKQFNNFKTVYSKYNTDLIPVIDIEDRGNNYDNINLVNQQLSELIELFHNEYGTYPIIYLGSLNAIKTIPAIYKCKIWARTLKYSKYVPNFSIRQIAVNKIGCNYIDLNYSSNINNLKLK